MPLYCNAALAGLPLATVTPLQRVQDSAARLIFQLNTREHVTPCLLQSQWHLLPVAYAGVFSANCMCCVVHSACYGTCPACLSNIVEPISARRTRSGTPAFVQHRQPTTTRGDQKVLQFGYKKLPYYMLSFFDYHATSMVIFNFRSLLFML